MRSNISIVNNGEKGMNLELRKYSSSLEEGDSLTGATLLVDGDYFISIYRDDTYSIHAKVGLKLSTHDLSGVIAALAEIGYDVVKRPDAAEASEKEE